MTDKPIETFEHAVFDDGLVICGDCNDKTIFGFVKNHIAPHKFAAIVTDPPYGNIFR